MQLSTDRYAHSGFTLIELMIAVTVGLILIGGLIQVYLGSKQSYNVAESSSRVQENGRFSIDLMARDIRMADFWGCVKQPDSDDITNNIDPAGPNYDATVNGYGDGITGTNNTGYNGSDSITLGGAFGSGIAVEPPYMNTSAAIVHASTGNGLKQGDIVLLSDCTNGDVFQVTNANPSSSGSLVHNTGSLSVGGVDQPGNYNPTAGCTGGHCLSKTYGMDAQIYEVRNFTYDIQLSATTGNPGLFRNDQEIIENVEVMQILYGEDTDNDLQRTPNRYVSANNVANPDNIVSVRIALLMSSADEFLPGATAQNFTVGDVVVARNDRRLRRVYTTTVTIRNRVP